jgi:hypothetical protein
VLNTLSQARTKLRKFVDGGSCNTTTIDETINDALERLMDAENWDCLEVMTRITTCNATFALPYNAAKLVAVDFNGTPGKVFGRAYQFMHAGPGDLDFRANSSGIRDAVDLGDGHPTMFDIPHKYTVEIDGTESDVEPEGLYLAAFCTEESDSQYTLKVTGFDTNGEESQNEEVPIRRWADGVEGAIFGVVSAHGELWGENSARSETKFSDVTRVIKPETTGYVSLYAIDPSNYQMFFLAKYNPRQTIPAFHRYRITNKSVNSESRDSILALLKLRYVPLADADDVIPINSMQALKLMVMAISEENKLNIQGAAVLEARAREVLTKKEESVTQTHGMPTIIDADYRTSLGQRVNRRVIL